MAAWGLVKDLKLDLNDFSVSQIDTVLKNMNSGEIESILASLAAEREKNEEKNQVLDLAFRIAEFVLSKGIPLI